MKKVRQEYREFFGNFPSIVTSLSALGFFLASLVINFIASQYAFVRKDNPVTDILLDNLPVVNMDMIFSVSTWIFIVLIVIFLLLQPKRIPFTLKTISFFIIIRSAFVMMTHIGPSPFSTLTTPSEIGRAFTSGADLFFSGHTGMPFLFALLYWHNRKLRWIFIIISIMAAAGVLLGHIHYSIDVASAYFITHGIYVIATRWFNRDYRVFHHLDELEDRRAS
jgi:hypothetical protein